MITEITKHIDNEERTLSEEAQARLQKTEGGPFLINDWEDIIFIHYEVNPTALQPYVPFELDTRDGKAYVSVVSFHMRRLHPRFGDRLTAWLFFPIANHEFLNLRTYVRYSGEGGIYFLAEWLPNRMSVALGPWLYGLPYRFGRFACNCSAEVSCEVRAMAGTWKYHTTMQREGPVEAVQPGSLEEFLMERYVAFTDRGGRNGFFRVWHEPWRQRPVTITVENDSLPASTGAWFDDARLIGGNHSTELRNVWIGRPHGLQKVDQAVPTDRQRSGHCSLSSISWLPLVLLPLAVLVFGFDLPAWAFMWLLAFAIYAGCKWLTLWQARAGAGSGSVGRQLGYLLLWPGMDAPAFLDTRTRAARPRVSAWLFAAGKTLFGAALLWGGARLLPYDRPLLVGWTGMVGLIFLMHFGTFHLLALLWQYFGVDARPVMRAPILARSIGDFWGRRWNAGFHDLAHRFMFRPLEPLLGKIGATMLVFFGSGLIHELVISIPAAGGYGLPTAYFLIQGAGMVLERGRANRLFTYLVTTIPVFWLFHPAFVTRVIIPFMRAIGAL